MTHEQTASEAGSVSRWFRSWRFDPLARILADRHYSRRAIGSQQFVAPGRCLVLITEGSDAFWVTSWPKFASHAWPGAWVCSAFRNEGAELSSALIRDAVAATRAALGEAPSVGMVTFVNAARVRRKRDPGRCFRRAGFVSATPAKTKGGHGRDALVVLQLLPGCMPAPKAARQRQIDLWGSYDA